MGRNEYSSVGPEWLDYVKPEVSCYSSLGTSFSAPIITGLAACLLESDSTFSAHQLKQAIIQSAHLAEPNNYIGYGVPNAGKALEILEGSKPPPKQINSAKNSFTLIPI